MNNINIPEHVDVAIIGGGMAGLSAAASLSQMGVKNVAVFESEKLAHCDGSSFGAVSYTHLTLPTSVTV